MVLAAGAAVAQPTANHQALISTGTTGYGWATLPSCSTSASAILYTTASSSFSCNSAIAAATATALAANPAACGAGQFVNDIAANGDLTCATPAGGCLDCICNTCDG